MKERIGIFGCTADPFTIAHREIVKQVLKQKLVDAVIIAPTIVDYHREGKTSWLTSFEKTNVIKAMTKDLGVVYVDDSELKRKAICESSGNELKEHAITNWRFIDTLLRIKIDCMNKGVDKDFYPIIGGDEFKRFKTWFAWKEIVNQSAGLIVVERQGEKIDRDCTPDIDFHGKVKTITISNEFANVSASAIREEYKDKLCTDYLANVLDQIYEMEKEDATRQSNILLHTPIFDVVKGKKTKTGLEPILVNAPDWVSIIAERHGKFLVEKQFRYGANDYVEEFPCGMVEKDEDLLDAARRELLEETGIYVVDKRDILKLGQTNPNPAFMTNMMHYYYVNLDNASWEQRKQKFDEHEEIELSWKDKYKFMFDLADDAHACGKKQVPAIALSMVKLYENASNYPSCGG